MLRMPIATRRTLTFSTLVITSLVIASIVVAVDSFGRV
jgi:hypothetical protein